MMNRVDTTIDVLRGVMVKKYKNGKITETKGIDTGRGYRRFETSKGVREYAHKVIWTLVNGPILNGFEIDHINGDRSDNRIANLRVVSRGQNNQNRLSANSNSKSGVKGVIWDSRCSRWRAEITHNYVNHFLGYHNSVELAQAAYSNAAALFHTHNPHATK